MPPERIGTFSCARTGALVVAVNNRIHKSLRSIENPWSATPRLALP
jgi:hypothetical protein